MGRGGGRVSVCFVAAPTHKTAHKPNSLHAPSSWATSTPSSSATASSMSTRICGRREGGTVSKKNKSSRVVCLPLLPSFSPRAHLHMLLQRAKHVGDVGEGDHACVYGVCGGGGAEAIGNNSRGGLLWIPLSPPHSPPPHTHVASPAPHREPPAPAGRPAAPAARSGCPAAATTPRRGGRPAPRRRGGRRRRRLEGGRWCPLGTMKGESKGRTCVGREAEGSDFLRPHECESGAVVVSVVCC